MSNGKKPSVELDMTNLLAKECKNSVQYEILSAWVSKDYPRFMRAIEQQDYDLEYVYKDFYNMRLIDLTCKVVGCEDYVMAIIRAGANINSCNPNSRKTPLHYAAESGNVPVMKLLIQSGSDVNLQDDSGDTPLHCIVRKWEPGKVYYIECFRLLLKHEMIEINVPNRKGYTPVHLAATMGELDIVNVLLENGQHLDLDSYTVGHNNVTAREEIFRHYPHLEEKLPRNYANDPAHQKMTYRYRLFQLIENKQEIRFCQTFREALQDKSQRDQLVSYHDGHFTYLQYACEKGLTKAAKMLIKNGADVNFAPRKTEAPISLACRYGHHEILTWLFSNKDICFGANELGETPLHIVCKYPANSTGHQECLRKLLEHYIDVNVQDEKEKTPLHYAVKYGGEKCVFELLNHGALMDIPDKFGETPIANLSYSTLKKYLDSKITTNGELPKDSNYAVLFDYQFLAAQNEGGREDPIHRFKTDLLLCLAKSSELKCILAHPIFSTIIMFKWHRIRMFFYVNLIFYALFCLLLSSYILLDESRTQNNSTSLNGINISSIRLARFLERNSTGALASFTENNSTESLRTIEDLDVRFAVIFRYILFIFVTVLTLTELIQMVSSQFQYFQHLENYLQISVIVLSSVLLSQNCHRYHLSKFCPQLSALSILLSWSEFFFTIGKHPKLTFYIDMFRTASGFLFRFLTVHTPLILAFALSFHTLFRECETCTSNPFSNPGKAVFQTIVMLTGELEMDSIPFDSYPGVSHIIFVAFIFLLAIVLFNLLIGLAVSATRPIEDDAFLYGCMAQVPIISYFESTFFSNTSPIKRILNFVCLSGCARRNSAFATTGRPMISIYPNQKNRMELKYLTEEKNVFFSKKSNIRNRMDQKIVEDSLYIITNKQDDKRKGNDKFDDLKIQLDSCRTSLEEEIKSCKLALIEILEKLETHEQDYDQDMQGTAGGNHHRRRKKKKSDALLRRLKLYGSWVDERVAAAQNLQLALKET